MDTVNLIFRGAWNRLTAWPDWLWPTYFKTDRRHWQNIKPTRDDGDGGGENWKTQHSGGQTASQYDRSRAFGLLLLRPVGTRDGRVGRGLWSCGLNSRLWLAIATEFPCTFYYWNSKTRADHLHLVPVNHHHQQIDIQYFYFLPPNPQHESTESTRSQPINAANIITIPQHGNARSRYITNITFSRENNC